MTFICERIKVIRSEGGIPSEFVWNAEHFPIFKVEKSWQEYGLPQSGSPKRQVWRLRRHRNYFQVLTEGGRRFQIYLDRGSTGARQEWILGQELKE
jgi:hypothetical protein